MKIPGFKRLRRLARWIRARFEPGTLILGYHRIADTADDPYGLCVSPNHFEEQLAVLNRIARPVSLARLVQNQTSGSLPSRSVVITFDDGYADFLHNAKPLLERYSIPCTIFVTTGAPGQMFWWDELEKLLFSIQEPTTVLISWIASQFQGFQIQQEWRKLDRAQLVLQLYRVLLRLADSERKHFFDRLQVDFGPAGTDAAHCRALSETELLNLASNELIEVGAHTVTHPQLATQPIPVQKDEIEQSKQYLEELTGRSVNFFSYPNGSWSKSTERLVRAAGFLGACGSYNDVIRNQRNLFYLPRFWVSNYDGVSFSRWLNRWLAG